MKEKWLELYEKRAAGEDTSELEAKLRYFLSTYPSLTAYGSLNTACALWLGWRREEFTSLSGKTRIFWVAPDGSSGHRTPPSPNPCQEKGDAMDILIKMQASLEHDASKGMWKVTVPDTDVVMAGQDPLVTVARACAMLAASGLKQHGLRTVQ